MTKKKFLLLTLMALLLVALAACGGNNAEPTSNAGDTTNNNANDGNDTDADDNDDDDEEVDEGDPVVGQELFVSTCSACHGPAGEGIEGLGKDMTTSAFIAEQSDAQLLEFIKTGRPSGDPDNTTGVDMPPKGGNPALTDEQLLDIIAYIREIHE